MRRLLGTLKCALFVYLARSIHPYNRALLLQDPVYVTPSTFDDPLNCKDPNDPLFGLQITHFVKVHKT